MKNKILAFLIPVLLLMFCASCNSHGNTGVSGSFNAGANEADNSSGKGAFPVMVFDEDSHDFGKLIEGEKVTYAFKFKNTGKAPLIISNVSTSCGCTVSSYPKSPVKPGDGATIDVSFNSEGKHGFQSKSITVNTNAQPPVATLQIQSQIIDSEEK